MNRYRDREPGEDIGAYLRARAEHNERNKPQAPEPSPARLAAMTAQRERQAREQPPHETEANQ